MLDSAPKISSKTIQDKTLLCFFDRYAEVFESDYPRRLSPIVLFDGIDYVFRKLDQECADPDVLILHILEAGASEIEDARYMLALVREETGYSIKMFYKPTGELEGITTVEPGRVVWSPDTLGNSKHILRTKYYIGFTYLLAEQIPKISWGTKRKLN